MWVRWIVWLVFGLYVFTGNVRFDKRYREPYRILLVVGWLYLGYWFATPEFLYGSRRFVTFDIAPRE
jgi:hypothetical protein